MAMADAVVERSPRIPPRETLGPSPEEPEQIGGCDDPDDATTPEHDQAADGVPAHHVGCPAERRLVIDRNNVSGHDIGDRSPLARSARDAPAQIARRDDPHEVRALCHDEVMDMFPAHQCSRVGGRHGRRHAAHVPGHDIKNGH
jgi:hypothetical protein